MKFLQTTISNDFEMMEEDYWLYVNKNWFLIFSLYIDDLVSNNLKMLNYVSCIF